MAEYMALVGERCPDIAIKRLLALPRVTEVIKLPPDKMIARPIADHPDSLICIIDGKLYCHSSYSKTAKRELERICSLLGLELFSVDCQRSDKYPFDCAFNALTIPDRQMLIGRTDSLAEPLKAYCKANTRQGYAACTSLYVRGTVITADPSIERAAKELGVNVYKISGKDIALPGYNEGFIGGAGGAFEDTVCLFGSPQSSQSAREVEEFCRDNSLSLVCLEDGILTDRGGIKFVEIKE